MTPEEVAAVTAVTVALQQRSGAVEEPAPTPQISAWVDASRRSAQRALLQRGPWRLSGRMGGRTRV